MYYQGGNVIRLHYCSRHKKVQAFTHRKYLHGKGEGYEECADQLNTKLDSIIANIPLFYSQRKGTSKEKWSEKFIQSQYVLKYCSQYIDSEFAYKVSPHDIRVDLIECKDGQIRFVELKRIDDARMLKKSEIDPEVVEQVRKYRKFLDEYENDIVDYYIKLWNIKKDLKLPNTARPVSLNKEPLLLIFNRWQKTSTGRDEHIRNMEKRLQDNNIDYKIESEI